MKSGKLKLIQKNHASYDISLFIIYGTEIVLKKERDGKLIPTARWVRATSFFSFGVTHTIHSRSLDRFTGMIWNWPFCWAPRRSHTHEKALALWIPLHSAFGLSLRPSKRFGGAIRVDSHWIDSEIRFGLEITFEETDEKQWQRANRITCPSRNSTILVSILIVNWKQNINNIQYQSLFSYISHIHTHAHTLNLKIDHTVVWVELFSC